LLDHQKRVSIIDPKGDWWGLKASADGEGAGYPIITFGDFKNADASDVPINEHSGKHVAELITSGNRPAIIGFRGWFTSHMLHFWIDFAKGVFNANSGELYLIIDEAQNLAPKQWKMVDSEGKAGTAIHWTNRILSEGRGLGINIWVCSQRPQKVHNDTLDGCETLVAMRVVHPAARGAIADWIKGAEDKEKGKTVMESIGAMKRGEAIIWSPEIEFGPKRVMFPMFRTFDSFAPPQLQKKVIQRSWADVDLEAVKEKLASVIKEAKANDPKELRSELNKVRQELLAKQVALTRALGRPAEQRNTEIKTVEKPVLKDSQIRRLEKLSDRIEKLSTRYQDYLKKPFSEVSSLLMGLRDTVEKFANHPPAAQISYQQSVARPESRQHITREPMAGGENGELKISSTQQRILDAIAWLESIGNPNPTALQVGAIALIDATGGHFSNTVGPLSTHDLINREHGMLSLTEKGRRIAQIPDRIASLADYHNVLRERVRRARSAGGATVRILDAILSRGGADISVEEIGQETGLDHTGGHFSNTIGPLGTLGLIRRERGIVHPTEVLFPSGL
jgi:hypothetical protein